MSGCQRRASVAKHTLPWPDGANAEAHRWGWFCCSSNQQFNSARFFVGRRFSGSMLVTCHIPSFLKNWTTPLPVLARGISSHGNWLRHGLTCRAEVPACHAYHCGGISLLYLCPNNCHFRRKNLAKRMRSDVSWVPGQAWVLVWTLGFFHRKLTGGDSSQMFPAFGLPTELGRSSR